jgi:hypothetical protein
LKYSSILLKDGEGYNDEEEDSGCGEDYDGDDYALIEDYIFLFLDLRFVLNTHRPTAFFRSVLFNLAIICSPAASATL